VQRSLAGAAHTRAAVAGALTSGYAHGFQIAAAIALAGGLFALIIPSDRHRTSPGGEPAGGLAVAVE